jgi:hypothetical protein
MTVILVGGSPDSIALLEKTIDDFEKVNAVKYTSREKPNACSYIFRYPEGVSLNMEFLRNLTIRINELFVNVVEDDKSTLFHEGKVKVFPTGE